MERVVQSTENKLIVTYRLGQFGTGEYELAYLWLPIEGALVLREVVLRLVGVAKALYRTSGNCQLLMDTQSSGPAWFLDELPLQFQPELRLNGREEGDISHLVRLAEAANSVAIETWNSRFGIVPTTSI